MDPDPDLGGPKIIRILRIRIWLRLPNTACYTWVLPNIEELINLTGRVRKVFHKYIVENYKVCGPGILTNQIAIY
jgi:hypothetical protein